MSGLGRAHWRRERKYGPDHRPRWWQVPEEPDEDADYDRFGMMFKVDTMERAWRDLINEYGFAAVMNARGRVGDDIKSVTESLRRWRKSRSVC